MRCISSLRLRREFRIAIIFFALLLFFCTDQSRAQTETSADAILGLWHTTDDKSQVKITQHDNRYYGQIVGITRPNWPNDDKLGMGGKPRTDRKNPVLKLRQRPLVGIEIMSNFAYEGKDIWSGGKIYDPESGKTYKCKLTLTKDRHLEVRGYIGFELLGRTVVWTR